MNEYYDFDMSLKGTEMNLSAIYYSPRIISGLYFFVLLLRQIYFEIGRLDIYIHSNLSNLFVNSSPSIEYMYISIPKKLLLFL